MTSFLPCPISPQIRCPISPQTRVPSHLRPAVVGSESGRLSVSGRGSHLWRGECGCGPGGMSAYWPLPSCCRTAHLLSHLQQDSQRHCLARAGAAVGRSMVKRRVAEWRRVTSGGGPEGEAGRAGEELLRRRAAGAD